MRLIKPTLIFAFACMLAISYPLPAGGGTVQAGTPVTLGLQSPGTATAWGGNITSVNLSINSTTLHWQGFYGTLSASMAISAGSQNISLRSWNLSSLSGQVYISQASNINFSALNSTSASLSDVDAAHSFLSGANDAATKTGADSANPSFSIGQYEVRASSYPLITTKDNLGAQSWQEVVLRHSSTSSASDFVYVGILNQSGTAFNGEAAHFQVIVPENSVGNWLSTTYYVYAEVK